MNSTIEMNPNSSQTTNQPLTRRSFLKSSSAAVAGGALLGALPIARFAHGASNDDTIRIALIGCGGRGSGAANQALNTSGSIQLVAMADAFEDRLMSAHSNLAEHHEDKMDVPPERRFVGFDAYKQAMEVADVVLIATPPGFRPIHFEEAVRQGKHIFMEKPLATDSPGVRRVLATAAESKKKNLKVVVGLQRHYDPGYQETIKRLHDGAIGDIVSGRCYWNGSGVWIRDRASLEQQAGRKLTEMEYQMRNWYYFVWLCGDHIVEQHIHNLDVMNWVKNGFPVSCHGMGGRQVRTGPDTGQIFDHHAVEYEYSDGSRMFSQCRHIEGCWNQVSEHVVGTKGNCNVTAHLTLGENRWRYRSDEPMDPYQREHDVFFAAIRNDKPINDAEWGAKSTLTAIMGRYATYSGKIIQWEEALNSEISIMPETFAWDATPPVVPDEHGNYPVPVPGKTDVV